MNIHEYQAKAVLKEFGVATSKGAAILKPEDAEAVATQFSGPIWVVNPRGKEIAGNAPLAIRAMKRLYRHGLTEDFPAHTHHVLLQTMQLFGTKDFYEGISSFAEGRDPEFQGR